jgi:hypothetical protein
MMAKKTGVLFLIRILLISKNVRPSKKRGF